MKLFEIIKGLFSFSFGFSKPGSSCIPGLHGQSACGGSSIYNNQSCFITNKDAAYIIRRMVVDRANGESRWFELEMADHANSSVAVAIRLCWYYADMFPGNEEACGKRAEKYFLKIADMLEAGAFDDISIEKCDEMLDRDDVPAELKVL